MTTADIVWGLLLLAGVVYEIAAIRSKRWEDTLSQTTR